MWRNHTRQQLFFSLLFFVALSHNISKNAKIVHAQNSTNTIPVKVGVVLDMDSWFGKMGLSCINMSLSDFYASHAAFRTRLVLYIRDSKKDVVTAASAALDLIKNVEVQAIIGPQESMQTNFVAELGDKAHVPIISFSATSPSLSSTQTPYFIRATHNDTCQVKAITAIVQAFGWREVVPVFVDNMFGNGLIPYLVDALTEVGVAVPYRSIISPSATVDQIAAELYKLMTMQTRVFVMHMERSHGSPLFLKAKAIGMMGNDYVWIMTNGMTNFLSSIDHDAIESMQGVLGVRSYIPRTKRLKNFEFQWKTKFQQEQEQPSMLNQGLNVYGLWAYDTATALAMAAENIELMNFSFQKNNISGNSTDLESIGVSQVGPALRNTLLSTSSFTGLSGDFHIIDGQLQSSAFEIVNVIGNVGRRVGFWTLDRGISKELNSSGASIYSTSKDNLGAIVWPGDSTSPPKGWVIPTNGKSLKIGVPVKDGFKEFVDVKIDPRTKAPIVTGYCIDLFDAVMHSLPYAVSYEYVPFAKADGTSAGSYEELIDQVYLQNYFAVVGDITIIANRSNYVDFTMPYTESGVMLIVPIKDRKSKNAWVFLRPLTTELWATSGCFLAFIGFVIWVLEHRVNDDFRGTPSHQLGMIFWFSFSTLVFAHSNLLSSFFSIHYSHHSFTIILNFYFVVLEDKVVSNLARFVVIVWVFVVLILTSSYTASLTSLLTVQQLQPTISDVNELIRRGEYIGYQRGSFVADLLRKMGFHNSKFWEYNTIEELDEALSKGSGNGGIAAAFDEIPYMRLFLAKYCPKYTMVQPTYKTDGFGFVLPRGSPLVADVSRAVLNVTEGEIMMKIEEKWFGQQYTCSEASSLSVSSTSNSLGLDSFWGLFLIAGIASCSTLIIFMTSFLYNHRYDIMDYGSKHTPWKKFVMLAKSYDKKDLSSHTFRKSEQQQYKAGATSMSGKIIEALHNADFPQSPSSFSLNSDGNFSSFGGQGSGSPTSGDAAEDIGTSSTELDPPSFEVKLRTPDPIEG
ncbi:Ionotropic glutamate receptor [Dillenia turbinata]|uniref:Ionotropic glutamate receptor n=1 Tax=Dillenia turbinata TaxID=194707 RepID=A0AAN8UBN2_9MAGN